MYSKELREKIRWTSDDTHSTIDASSWIVYYSIQMEFQLSNFVSFYFLSLSLLHTNAFGFLEPFPSLSLSLSAGGEMSFLFPNFYSGKGKGTKEPVNTTQHLETCIKYI